MSSKPLSRQGNNGIRDNKTGATSSEQSDGLTGNLHDGSSADDGRALDSTAIGGSEDQPRYQWPPPRDPNLVFGHKTRNPVHALITALPLMMLMIGLYIYYRGESEQTHSAPIQAESVQLDGVFKGLSATSGRHYLWIEQDGVARGIRLREEHVTVLEDLLRGEDIQLQVAPTVQESATYWVLRVEQQGSVLLDTSTAVTNQ